MKYTRKRHKNKKLRKTSKCRSRSRKCFRKRNKQCGGKLNKSLKNIRNKYISRRGRNNKKNRRLSVKQRGGYPEKTFEIEGTDAGAKLLIRKDVVFGFEGHVKFGDNRTSWIILEFIKLTNDGRWRWSSQQDTAQWKAFEQSLTQLTKINSNVTNTAISSGFAPLIREGGWNLTTLKYIVPIFRVPEIPEILNMMLTHWVDTPGRARNTIAFFGTNGPTWGLSVDDTQNRQTIVKNTQRVIVYDRSHNNRLLNMYRVLIVIHSVMVFYRDNASQTTTKFVSDLNDYIEALYIALRNKLGKTVSTAQSYITSCLDKFRRQNPLKFVIGFTIKYNLDRRILLEPVIEYYTNTRVESEEDIHENIVILETAARAAARASKARAARAAKTKAAAAEEARAASVIDEHEQELTTLKTIAQQALTEAELVYETAQKAFESGDTESDPDRVTDELPNSEGDNVVIAKQAFGRASDNLNFYRLKKKTQRQYPGDANILKMFSPW